MPSRHARRIAALTALLTINAVGCTPEIHRYMRFPDLYSPGPAPYQRAEAILMDDVPILPIYHYTRTFLIQKNVRGFPGNILGYYVYHKVWLDD